MKKTIVVLVVACTMLANFSAGSLVSAPIIQAQAQDSSVIGSVISTIISFVSSIFKGDEDKGDDDAVMRMPVYAGAQDCHDELRYYYKRVKKADGTIEDRFVASVEFRFGEMIGQPPTDYTYWKQEYYKENKHHERIECNGAKTTSPCTPRILTCQEQNP